MEHSNSKLSIPNYIKEFIGYPPSDKDDTLFKITGYTVQLISNFEEARFVERTERDSRYIGNITLDDFEIEKIGESQLQRDNIKDISLIDLANQFHRLTAESTYFTYNYTLNNIKKPFYPDMVDKVPFELIIDPCKYYKNKDKQYKNFTFIKTNEQIHKSLNQDPEEKENLYTWIGQNNSGKKIEEVNLYFILLPSTSGDFYNDMSPGQMYNYINNIMVRFTQVYDGVSKKMLDY